MNPYDPPVSTPAIFDSSGNPPVSRRHWLAVSAVASANAIGFGAFVFFTLLQILGVFVNWPNVVPILVAAFLTLAILRISKTNLLHDKFATQHRDRYAYSVGVLLGLVAALAVRAGII